jgi:hypothetical protein
LISKVPFPILGKLFVPESQLGLWASTAARMLVPKAAMNENDFSMFGEHYVGLTGQIPGV